MTAAEDKNPVARIRSLLGGSGVQAFSPHVTRVQDVDDSRAESMHVRTRVAYFPIDRFNPYQRLFYRDLTEAGIEVVPDSKFTTSWLARHRHGAPAAFEWSLRYHGRPMVEQETADVSAVTARCA
jgi:hypothetical protein